MRQIGSYVTRTPHTGVFPGPNTSNLYNNAELTGRPLRKNLSQPGSVHSLLPGRGTFAASNFRRAASLVGVQSQAASELTNLSQSSQAESTGHLDPYETFKRGKSITKVVTKTAVALTRSTSRLGRAAKGVGAVTSFVGSAISLPAGVANAVNKFQKARKTGSRSDVAQAFAGSSEVGSIALGLTKGGFGTAEAITLRGARKAATQAFKQVAPDASEAVVKSVAKQVGREFLGDSSKKALSRGLTAGARQAAMKTGTLAGQTGAIGRTAAKKLLAKGGKEAAEAATKAVAKSAFKSGAKAAGRFVPGLNVGIAAFDTATAAATLADPKATTGKKVTSVITAAGSIVAATNIPVVSQVGAAVSAVSGFIGAFF